MTDQPGGLQPDEWAGAGCGCGTLLFCSLPLLLFVAVGVAFALWMSSLGGAADGPGESSTEQVVEDTR